MAAISFINPLDQPTGRRRMLAELSEGLRSREFTELRIMVAFAKIGPLLRLSKDMRSWRTLGKKIQALFGIDQLGTSREALDFANTNFDRSVVVYADARGAVNPTFHPKVYLFSGLHHSGDTPGMRIAHGYLLALSCYFLAACGTEPSGPASPSGAWRFDAAWGACTISAATLTLQWTGGQWAGTMTGGEQQCAQIPGEAPSTFGPFDTFLDSIRVTGDSISFEMYQGYYTVLGRVSAQGMDGIIEVIAPFCQCTDVTIEGSWSATRP